MTTQPSTWTASPWRVLGDRIVQTAHVTRDVWTIPHSDGDLERICQCVNFLAPHPDLTAVCVMRREDVEKVRTAMDVAILRLEVAFPNAASILRDALSLLPADGKVTK